MTDARSSNRRRIQRRDLLAGEYGEPWYRLPKMAAGWILERLESYRLSRSAELTGYDLERFESMYGHLRSATEHIVHEIEHGHGRRFQISSRSLASIIGMSQSTASRYLRMLVELGIIKRWRDHRKTKRRGRWIAQAAIHEVMTHPPSLSPEGVSHDPWTAETSEPLLS